MMMIPQSSISLFTTVLVCLNFVSSGKGVCTDEQLNEAQRAFRNCVESAKAGIVSSFANEQNEALVCRSLETMLEDCNSEVSEPFYIYVNAMHRPDRPTADRQVV